MESNAKVICPQCHKENEEHFKFCTNCGAVLSNTEADIVVNQPETAPAYGQESAAVNLDKPSAEEPTAVNLDKLPAEEPAAVNLNKLPEEEPAAATLTNQPAPVNPQSQYTSAGPTFVSRPPEPAMHHSQQNRPYDSNGIGFSIASMVCGIVGLLSCCFSTILGIPVALVAIVLGVVALVNKYDGKGMAIAGVVMGGVFLALFLMLIIIFGLAGIFQTVAGLY